MISVVLPMLSVEPGALTPFFAAQKILALPGLDLVPPAGLCLTFGSASHK